MNEENKRTSNEDKLFKFRSEQHIQPSILQKQITINNIVSNLKNKQRRSFTTRGSEFLDIEKLEKLTNPNFKVYTKKVNILQKESVNIYGKEKQRSRKASEIKFYSDDGLVIDKISIEINKESIREQRKQSDVEKRPLLRKSSNTESNNDNCDLALKHTETIEKTYEYLLEKLHSLDFYSMIIVVIQICNSIIRYTFLTMPIVFANLGLINANIMVALVGALSILTLFYIMKAHEITGHT